MPDNAKPKVAADDADKGGMGRLLKGLEALNSKIDSIFTRVDSIEAKQAKKKARADDDDEGGGEDKPKPPLPTPGAEGEPSPVAADKKRKDDDQAVPPKAKAAPVPPMPPPKLDDDDDDEGDDKKMPPEFLKNIKKDDDDDEGDDKEEKEEEEKEVADDAGGKKVAWGKGGKSRADTVRVKTTDLNALRRELAEVRARLPKDRGDEDAAAMAEDQARCDSVALMFGASAPRPLAGETRAAYRLRMLEPYKKYSANWKDVPLEVVAVDEAALGVVEKQIYDTARFAARDPASVPVGTLRAVQTRTPTGHLETRFMGSPSVWLNRGTPNRRYVKAINLMKDNRP